MADIVPRSAIDKLRVLIIAFPALPDPVVRVNIPPKPTISSEFAGAILLFIFIFPPVPDPEVEADILAPFNTRKELVLRLIEPASLIPLVSVNNPLGSPEELEAIASIELACIFILPATPFPIVSVLISPPLSKLKFSVFIVTFPAFPVDSVRVNKRESLAISTLFALAVL